MTALTHLTVAISTIGSSETPDQQDITEGRVTARPSWPVVTRRAAPLSESGRSAVSGLFFGNKPTAVR